MIRAVQDARKAADLQISDRIALKLVVPAEDVAKVEQFKELVSSETLATSFEVTAGDELNVEVAKAEVAGWVADFGRFVRFCTAQVKLVCRNSAEALC
mgnify:FL=1